MSEYIENLKSVSKNRILAYTTQTTLWFNHFKKWYEEMPLRRKLLYIWRNFDGSISRNQYDRAKTPIAFIFLTQLEHFHAKCLSKICFIKEIKNAPSALLSYISTREFVRTRREVHFLHFSHFSSVLKNSRVLITQQCTRNKFFIFFYKIKTTTKGQEFVRQQKMSANFNWSTLIFSLYVQA